MCVLPFSALFHESRSARLSEFQQLASSLLFTLISSYLAIQLRPTHPCRKPGIMLSESMIDTVMGGVRQCHRELIEHGATVVLEGLVTANKPAPSAPAATRTPGGAPKQHASTLPASSPPSKRLRSEASESFPKKASTPWSSQRSSSPASASSSAFQPGVVALDLFANGPRESHLSSLFQHLTVSELSNRDFTFLNIYGGHLVAKTDHANGTDSRPVDLVLWHRSEYALELQADGGFTTTSVTNALAREIALNSARALLLEHIDWRTTSGKKHEEDDDDDYAPEGAHHPAVVDFVARFRANLITLVDEVTSAPAAFSTPGPNMSQTVEDELREHAASNRRKRADWNEEYQGLSKEVKAATQATTSVSASSASASPAPAGDIPEKPVSGRSDEPDTLASPPPKLVLRPMEDLFRVFTEAEIMDVFSKVILSRDDCVLCPGFELWFEKKRAVTNECGAVRLEYGLETGDPYC